MLGLDDPDAYARQNVFLGAICGRVANRIRDARFTLGGVTYHLDANDPPHHLHGGAPGLVPRQLGRRARSGGSRRAHPAPSFARRGRRVSGRRRRAGDLHAHRRQRAAHRDERDDRSADAHQPDQPRLLEPRRRRQRSRSPADGLRRRLHPGRSGRPHRRRRTGGRHAARLSVAEARLARARSQLRRRPHHRTDAHRRAPRRPEVGPHDDRPQRPAGAAGLRGEVSRRLHRRPRRPARPPRRDLPRDPGLPERHQRPRVAQPGAAPPGRHLPAHRRLRLRRPTEADRCRGSCSRITSSTPTTSSAPGSSATSPSSSSGAAGRSASSPATAPASIPRAASTRSRTGTASQIHRVFRPPWTQARPFQRLANSGWMTAAWLARIAELGPFDAVVVGSDPAFSPMLGRGLRRLLPARRARPLVLRPLSRGDRRRRGGNAAVRMLVPAARQLMKWGYGAYDALVDIGPRMQERLAAYGTGAAATHAGPLGAGRAAGAPPSPIRACTRRALSRAPSWRCSTRGRWGAPTTTGRSSSWPAPAGPARATTSRSASRRAATGRTSSARRSRPPTPTSPSSRSPTRRRCRRGSAPPTFISSACSPSGRASWSRRSSSARWPSGGPCSTRARQTPRSRAGSPTYDVGLTLARRHSPVGRRPVARAHRTARRPRALASQRLRRLPARVLEEGRQRSLGRDAARAGRPPRR